MMMRSVYGPCIGWVMSIWTLTRNLLILSMPLGYAEQTTTHDLFAKSKSISFLDGGDQKNVVL